jgi:hypothetical protein
VVATALHSIDDRPAERRPDLLELVDSRDDLNPSRVVKLLKQSALDPLGEQDLPRHDRTISQR